MLQLVLGVLAFVLTVVADVKVLLDIIVKVALGDCLCELIKAVVALVDGLLAALVPIVFQLLPNVVDIVLSLSLNIVGTLLAIL